MITTTFPRGASVTASTVADTVATARGKGYAYIDVVALRDGTLCVVGRHAGEPMPQLDTDRQLLSTLN